MKSIIPPLNLEKLSEHSESSTECGALMSPECADDYVYENVATSTGYYYAEMPAEHIINTDISPRDQGTRGTCAAFAGAHIKEIHNKRSNGSSTRLSPEFLYANRANTPGKGMYGRNVFQILNQFGVCDEAAYPYQKSDTASPKLSSKEYMQAGKNRIAGFARVTSVDGLKRALLECGPCYLQLPLYKARPEFWRARDESEKPRGGHALCVIGYNDIGFVLVNSWGKDWNGNGQCVLLYDEWSLVSECWAPLNAVEQPVQKKNPKRLSMPVRAREDKNECSLQ